MNAQDKTVRSEQGRKRRESDTRVRRTRARLGSALHALIQDRDINDVTLREVLAHASVGRSTFYLHFSDKNDLLLSLFEEFLEMMSTALSVRSERSKRLAPVAEMFAHVGNQTKVYQSLAKSGRLQDFFDLAQGYLTRGIEQRLKEVSQRPAIPLTAVNAHASALSGSLLSLLRWWLNHGAKEPPAEMDAMFHRMAWNGLQQTP